MQGGSWDFEGGNGVLDNSLWSPSSAELVAVSSQAQILRNVFRPVSGSALAVLRADRVDVPTMLSTTIRTARDTTIAVSASILFFGYDEASFNDSSLVTVSSPGGEPQTLVTRSMLHTGSFSSSGWVHITQTVSVAGGEHTLTFVVQNFADDFGDSWLLVDNVRVCHVQSGTPTSTRTPSYTPSPSTTSTSASTPAATQSVTASQTPVGPWRNEAQLFDDCSLAPFVAQPPHLVEVVNVSTDTAGRSIRGTGCMAKLTAGEVGEWTTMTWTIDAHAYMHFNFSVRFVAMDTMAVDTSGGGHAGTFNDEGSVVDVLLTPPMDSITTSLYGVNIADVSNFNAARRWDNVAVMLHTPGLHALTFRVRNVGDSDSRFSSYLLVDNVTVAVAPVTMTVRGRLRRENIAPLVHRPTRY